MERKKAVPEIEKQWKMLPIFKCKSRFLKLVAENKVVIVNGETGSGKTTQIPQFLAEAGYGNSGCIGCTLPRRIAVESAATRVSEEYGCKLGQEVGYEEQFEKRTSKNTIVKYMTDEILVSECAKDPELKNYSVVIIDEIHERTVHTDLLFGMVKEAISNRKALKLILCSVELGSERFFTYFSCASVPTVTLNIPGHLFPVEVLYTNDDITDRKANVQKIASLVIEIHKTDAPGDVLVFLPGQENIDNLCAILQNEFECHMSGPQPIVLPLRSTLAPEQQKKLFEMTPNNSRKIILDTNIAESLLAIDGIVYVIDSGLIRQKIFQQETGTYMVKTRWISQAQAKRRAKRVGWAAIGKCFRLYSRLTFNNMQAFPMPEIKQCNLVSPVLKLKLWSNGDIFKFPFVQAPSHHVLAAAIYHLMVLGALSTSQTLTELGCEIANFPVDLEPCLVKLLFLSERAECLPEALTLVSLLSVQHKQKLYRSLLAKRAKTMEDRSLPLPLGGDYCALLEVYEEWRNHKYSNKWCTENSVSACDLEEAKKIRKRLVRAMNNQGLSLTSGSDSATLRKALCAAFFHNAAKPKNIYVQGEAKCGYAALGGGRFLETGLNNRFGSQPAWIVYHEVVQNGRTLLHGVTPIRPEWLSEVAPEFFSENKDGKVSTTNMFSALKRAAVKSQDFGLTALEPLVESKNKSARKSARNKRVAPEKTSLRTANKLPAATYSTISAGNESPDLETVTPVENAWRFPLKKKNNSGCKTAKKKSTPRGKASNLRALMPPKSSMIILPNAAPVIVRKAQPQQ